MEGRCVVARYRLYDWECQRCYLSHEELVEQPEGSPPPGEAWLMCEVCGTVTEHKRHRINIFAQYLADRPHAPLVKGGRFDTEGYRQARALPEFTGETAQDFEDFRHAKGYQEVKRERARQHRENQVKRERARLIREGANIDVRHHPLPGDPKL